MPSVLTATASLAWQAAQTSQPAQSMQSVHLMQTIQAHSSAHSSQPARGRVVRFTLAVGLLASVLAGAGGGCARPLLSPEDERSPFDRFDALRAQYAPQYIEDEYGSQKPNLRGRLQPRE